MLNLSINYLMSSVKINICENDKYNTTAKSKNTENATS